MEFTVTKAREFAAVAHGHQMYGDKPYTYHLDAVYDILVAAGVTDIGVLTAAYLHDTVEDTLVSLEMIRLEFGLRVATTVHALTDEPGANRKERKAKTYPKIRGNYDAVLVKLADRIANVEFSMKTNEGLYKMYQKENEEFFKQLYTGADSDEMEYLWRLLDNVLSDP